MLKAFIHSARLAAVGFALMTVPTYAEPTREVSELVLPESPNGYPMETVWDAAPGSVNGKITETGPYRISRWGDIVIRGRPEGSEIISALSFIQCGRNRNSATQVVLIGEAPDNLCDSVEPVAPGKIQSILGNDYTLYGKATGWTVVNFVQKVDGWTNASGMPPAEKVAKGYWGVNQLGALYRSENGKHVFYAPGETVDLGHDVKFIVKPVMDQQELQLHVVTAGLRAFSDLPIVSALENAKKDRPPLWFRILFYSSPFIILGGAGYGITRLMRRRRAQKQAILDNQRTGGLPTNPYTLRNP